MRIAVALLFVSVLSIGMCAQNDLATFERACAARNGKVVQEGDNLVCKYPATSTTSSTGGTNDLGLLGWLLGLDPASRMKAQQGAARKAAMLAELENQRQAAIARQDAERVRQIEEISRRLRTGDLQLKGLSPQNDLQLKMSPTGPIRFGEYMSTPATQTTRAQLTLKTGDEATKSMQGPATPPNASSAGVVNPNQPPAFNAGQMTPEQRELAEMLSKLTPEQQQKLIAAMKAADTAADTTATQSKQTATEPSASSPEETKESDTLTLKLSTDQRTAEDLKAAAEKGASPEQLKEQADDDFKRLQQTTLTATQTAKTGGGGADPVKTPGDGTVTSGEPQNPKTIEREPTASRSNPSFAPSSGTVTGSGQSTGTEVVDLTKVGGKLPTPAPLREEPRWLNEAQCADLQKRINFLRDPNFEKSVRSNMESLRKIAQQAQRSQRQADEEFRKELTEQAKDILKEFLEMRMMKGAGDLEAEQMKLAIRRLVGQGVIPASKEVLLLHKAELFVLKKSELLGAVEKVGNIQLAEKDVFLKELAKATQTSQAAQAAQKSFYNEVIESGAPKEVGELLASTGGPAGTIAFKLAYLAATAGPLFGERLEAGKELADLQTSIDKLSDQLERIELDRNMYEHLYKRDCAPK